MTAEGNPFGIHSSIPVLRMLDEEKAKAFYLEFLGYEIEWEHRFSPDSPLYLQIRLGESVLHLDGHANGEKPPAEVRIPVHDLEGFCEFLGSRAEGRAKPVTVDPRYTGKNTDMNIEDPFGNMITFWLDEGSD